MRTWTETHREGTNIGPVDWGHEWAAALPDATRAILREAEKRPSDFTISPSGFSRFRIVDVCMYDGWPYWRPGPAVAYVGPLGSVEWAWFNCHEVRSVSEGRPWCLADIVR